MSKPQEKKKVEKSTLKKVQEQIIFAQGLIKQKGEGAEAFLITAHFIKDGKIYHHHVTEHFPNGDWGRCLIAIGVQARNEELIANTGNGRVGS